MLVRPYQAPSLPMDRLCPKYHPNEYERLLGWELAKIRNSSQDWSKGNIPNEPMSEQGCVENHFQGILAEIAVSRVLNLCWTGLADGRGGGALDVGGMIEARSVRERMKGLLARPKDEPKRAAPVVNVYVAHAMDPKLCYCELLGWHFFGFVLDHGKPEAVGSGRPYWRLPTAETQPMATLVDWLKVQPSRIKIAVEVDLPF
jgi:hypothetical protein